MNGLEITMELLHFGIFSLVQQPLSSFQFRLIQLCSRHFPPV